MPYRFIGKRVKLLYSRTIVEIYSNYERIALHKREKNPYGYTTDKDHMATTHRFVTEWTPDKFLEWAASIHEDVRLYILKILDRKQHPEQAYKSCLGELGFAKKAGNERLTMACQRALSYGLITIKRYKPFWKTRWTAMKKASLPMSCLCPIMIISEEKTITNNH